jgi:carbohydrate-selective porin OprB
VLVSEDDSASIELEGSAGAISAAALQLGDARASLSVASQSGRIVQVVGGRKTALLYSCVRLKAAFWGFKRQVVRGGGTEDVGNARHESTGPFRPEEAFASADISELLA